MGIILIFYAADHLEMVCAIKRILTLDVRFYEAFRLHLDLFYALIIPIFEGLCFFMCIVIMKANLCLEI